MAAAMRYGLARGVFSNESGLGSAPIAAAAARTDDPVRQALVSMTQTFIDTLVVCSMTALVILTATPWTQGIDAAQLTSASFGETLGHTGELIVTLSITLFAYSTLIGWNYYGEKAIEYLMGPRAIVYYRVIFVAVVLLGATSRLELVWNVSDVMNGLMAIPNLIGLLLLAKIIKQETTRYFSTQKPRRRLLEVSYSPFCVKVGRGNCNPPPSNYQINNPGADHPLRPTLPSFSVLLRVGTVSHMCQVGPGIRSGRTIAPVSIRRRVSDKKTTRKSRPLIRPRTIRL